MKLHHATFAASALTASLLAAVAPATVQAGGHYENPNVTIYFTRHAEKKTTTVSLGDATTTYDYDANADEVLGTPGIDDDGTATTGASKGDNLDEVCGTSKCAEELNAFGLVRANLLAEYFSRRGVVDELDAVYSSHKVRTRQTVEPTAIAAGLSVQQLPADGTELQPESTTPSECLTLEAIRAAAPGSTLLVAGHSGTLYDIMGDGNDDCAGLGLLSDDDASSDQFPKDSKGKVRDFGDIWKVTLRSNGTARLNNRVNLDVPRLTVMDRARGH